MSIKMIVFANKSDLGSYTYAGTNYANPHAVTSVNGTTYTYDNNGNLTGDGTRTNTWDYRNQLSQTVKASTTYRYLYDQGGQRTAYHDGSATTTYPNKYYDVRGATTTKHIYANGELVATIEKVGASTSTLRYMHLDHLGGTSIVSDANGNLVEIMSYYPFGQVRIDEKQGGYVGEKRKFTGHEYDEQTSLYYMMARYQNPSVGRFVSQDPAHLAIGDKGFEGRYHQKLSDFLTNPQQLNSYSYANNNPLIMKDENGEFAVLVPLAFMGTGALINVSSLALSDYATGHMSSWQTYSGAAAGGAAGGLAALSGWGAIASGAASGGVQNLTTQGLEYATGVREGGFSLRRSATEFGLSIGEGALFGHIGGKITIPGVTSGRNSFSAITQQVATKYSNGTIGSVSGSTAAKTLGALGVGSIPETAFNISVQSGGSSGWTYYSYSTPKGFVSGKVKTSTPSMAAPRGCLNCKQK